MRKSIVEKDINDLLTHEEPRPCNYCKWGLLIVTHSLTALLGFYFGKHIYTADSDGSS